MIMQKCNTCGNEYPLNQMFYKDKTRVTGYNNRCKICSSSYGEKWRSINPTKVKEYNSLHNKYDHNHYFPKTKRNSLDSLNKALVKGLIKKHPCLECGNINSEAHHADYENPLGVIWLCRKHHKQVHREHNLRFIKSSLDVIV